MRQLTVSNDVGEGRSEVDGLDEVEDGRLPFPHGL